MKTKQQIPFEIKNVSEEGTFEGLLSPYGTVDGVGDVVEAGAYTKTLKEGGNTRPLLWQHKTDVPIGELTLDDRADGLWCKGSLLMTLPEAQKAYLLLKAGIVKGLSIGFSTIRDAVDGGVRKLKEIKLYEGSVVTFPAHEGALITSVKKLRETKGDFNEELAEQQLCDARYQMLQALSAAITTLLWSDLSRDEKITASETVISQFAQAFRDFLPAYLDMMSEMYGPMETWSKKRFETKSGRMISAANKSTLQMAHEHMKSATDLIYPLLDCDAEDGTCEDSTDGITSKSKAGPPETKPAPDLAIHSALLDGLIDQMKALHN